MRLQEGVAKTWVKHGGSQVGLYFRSSSVSACNSSTNLIQFMSFCWIFSALSKYVLHFCVTCLWKHHKGGILQHFYLFHSIQSYLKTIRNRPLFMYYFMLHMSSSITPRVRSYSKESLCILSQNQGKRCFDYNIRTMTITYHF